MTFKQKPEGDGGWYCPLQGKSIPGRDSPKGQGTTAEVSSVGPQGGREASLAGEEEAPQFCLFQLAYCAALGVDPRLCQFLSSGQSWGAPGKRTGV